MTAGKYACGLCGRDVRDINHGGMSISGGREVLYCHGDDDPEPTCYMRAQWKSASVGEEDQP